MSPSRPPRSTAKPAREQVTLEFPDNKLLAALGGVHAKNFVRIEQRLGVRVSTRGNLVSIEGGPDAREQGPDAARRRRLRPRS